MAVGPSHGDHILEESGSHARLANLIGDARDIIRLEIAPLELAVEGFRA
jgi:hypothetical protein